MVAAEEEEEEEEDMEGEEEEEDDDGGEEDPTVTMTARMEHQVAQRARRASAPAMTASTPTTTFRPAPSQWSVEEVTSFITTLPGRTFDRDSRSVDMVTHVFRKVFCSR